MIYKLTGIDGSAANGGSGYWPLPRGDEPGEWLRVKGRIRPRSRGLHLVRFEDILHWAAPALWVAEIEPGATVVEAEDKVVVSAARLVRRVDEWNDRTLRECACDYVARVVHLCGDDPRPQQVIDVVRQYARGEATIADLDTARAGAWAADTAFRREDEGARAVGRSVTGASDAARAAGWAADTAGAKSSTWVTGAMAIAARLAAQAAVQAGSTTERAWQIQHLREMLGMQG